MNESKKLTIRINLRPQKNNEPKAKEKIFYQIHWGRAIGASLGVIGAIGLAIGGSSYYFDQDNTAYEQTEPALSEAIALTSKSKTTFISPVLENELAEDETSVTSIVTADQITEDEIADTAKVTPDQITEDETPDTAKITLDQITEDETPDTAKVTPEQITEDETPDTAKVTPDQITADETPVTANIIDDQITEVESPEIADIELDTISTADNTETLSIVDIATPALFTQSKTVVLSDNIKQFMMASAVTKLEPKGNINDIVFDDNDIATVYAYSEVKGLKGSTLYYIWSFDGKKVAKVRVDVGADHWRSYSSKYIQPNMQGEWKVELQNGQGEVIAINQFNY
ncbi:MAG: DUF2914 domain-containing protein [Psychromonas sp.]